jgi:hypothetical protein
LDSGVGRVACFAICLALGCATPLEQEAWHRVTTPHFEVVGGGNAGRSVEIAEALELFRAALAEFAIAANLEPRVPLLVVVFRDDASFARFRPRSGFEGFALPRSHRTFLVVHDVGDGQQARAIALHEYVHFLLRNGEAVHYPAWYDEGLAEFLSTLSIEGDHAVVGRVPPARARWLRYGSPLALRKIMTADDPYAWSDPALERFYAQAWALVDFFHVSDRTGFTTRGDQMIRYIQLVNLGVDPDAACQQAFGVDFEGLEREFLRYLGEGKLPYLGIPRAQLEIRDESRTDRLPEHEKRILLGDLALALGGPWSGEARHWFEAAVAARPDDARAHAGLGLTLALGGGKGSDAQLERALALDAADPEVQRLVGEALLEQAGRADEHEVPGLVQRARDHFRRSLALDPGQVAAHAGLGRSYLIDPTLSDPGEGLAALRTAHERLPADREIALALAQVELRAGAAEQARALLSQLPAPAHGDPAARAEASAIEGARSAAGLPPRPPVSARHLEARLDLAAPQDSARMRGGSGWTLVEGRGGLSEATLYDVLIAVDESASTLDATGSDVDGDGEVGRRGRLDVRNPDNAATDPGDSVIRAELEAARVLIGQLPESTTRVGLVTFAGLATRRAGLGAPAAAAQALADYRVHVDLTGTSLANALAYSMEEFYQQREPEVLRQRVILLLSDGQPTVPSKFRGQRDALELADQLGALGVPVHAFALGKEALEEPDFYRSHAERSGGRFVPVERPAEVVSHLAEFRLSGLESVTIRNQSSGESARAVRVFPDGSFDGYVPLVEGENRIQITAAVEGGRSLAARRTVYYELPPQPTAEDQRATAELLKELETRAVEIDLLAEIRRRRQPTTRALEVEVER